MFGYIRPCRDSLRMRDYDRYRAAYCGLCHASGTRCGFAARFLVSYDMTFLYLLLQSAEPVGCAKKCRCPARLKAKSCEVDSAYMDRAADLSVLLYYWKIRDEIADPGSLLRKIGCRAAALALRRAYRKAAAAQPEADQMIRLQLEKLAAGYPVEKVIVDPSAASFIAQLRRDGRFSVRKARNAVMPGIQLVSRLLETGQLQIGADCTNAIREFSQYRWQEGGQDMPCKEDDHAMDEIRYFCATVLGRI